MIRTAFLSRQISRTISGIISGAIALTMLGAPLHTAHAEEVKVSTSSSFAAEAPDLYRMLDSMGMYDIIAIMGTENTRGSLDVEEQLFPGAGGAAWQAVVMGLHSTDRMIALFEEALDTSALTAEDIAAAQAFLDSDTGQRLIAGEIAARRLFLEQAQVDAARDVLLEAVASDAPRLAQLQRFSEINGLIERNVSGALNLRFTFYRGLIAGGAFEQEVPEQLMLAEVWGQEPDMRQLTIEWLFSFQLTAYADASDADIEAYIAFSDSDAGRAVNGVLFEAFDAMLASLSYDLGIAAAGFIAGEDI